METSKKLYVSLIVRARSFFLSPQFSFAISVYLSACLLSELVYKNRQRESIQYNIQWITTATYIFSIELKKLYPQLERKNEMIWCRQRGSIYVLLGKLLTSVKWTQYLYWVFATRKSSIIYTFHVSIAAARCNHIYNYGFKQNISFYGHF